ncbi:MAG: cysteine hydrolase [Chloroflexi bacterium]|nr:cysteine hydrolase [Chloroflexota bacterium]
MAFDRTALLLTGFQNDFCHPRGALASAGRDIGMIERMLPATQRLLAAARDAGLIVLHVAELALAGGLSDSKAWAQRRAAADGAGQVALERTWGQRFLEGFEPRPDELAVTRFRPTSLSDARTEVLLRSSGARRLVVAGVETHLAVLATVVDAACRDYEVLVPADCIAGTRPDLHDATLALLPTWATIVTSADLAVQWSAPAGGRSAAGERQG